MQLQITDAYHYYNTIILFSAYNIVCLREEGKDAIFTRLNEDLTTL